MLQRDPSLDGVGLVIFDEFHERSLDADLALALTLETRDVLRPELRILVMSATLDGARVARLLGDAPDHHQRRPRVPRGDALRRASDRTVRIEDADGIRR